MSPLLKREDRAELRKHTLTTKQVDALERALPLPLAKAWMMPAPAMNDVLDKLVSISSALKAALDSCISIADGPLSTQIEARNRIIVSDGDLGGDGDALRGAIAALTRASIAAQRALDELPKDQRRTNAVSRHVLRLIDSALEKSGAFNRSDSDDSLRRSSTPGSDYSEIVRICLFAIGVLDPNPERPVQAHLRWLKARRTALSGAMDSHEALFSAGSQPWTQLTTARILRTSAASARTAVLLPAAAVADDQHAADARVDRRAPDGELHFVLTADGRKGEVEGRHASRLGVRGVVSAAGRHWPGCACGCAAARPARPAQRWGC